MVTTSGAIRLTGKKQIFLDFGIIISSGALKKQYRRIARQKENGTTMRPQRSSTFIQLIIPLHIIKALE